jgi:hypothetical protein
MSGEYSIIYVFNKLSNTIESILYDKYDKQIHMPINDRLLEKLSKKNHQRLKQFIEKIPNYKKKYFHVTTHIITNIVDTTKNENSWLGNGIYKNPIGIWFSCGVSWQNYIGYIPNKWALSTYIYEIIPSKNILHITSIAELIKFINKYKKKKIKITDVIDWKSVKNNYDGLIICPYLGDKIWGKKANELGIYGNKNKINEYYKKIIGNKKENIYFLAEWYRHWEAGTGVIWNKNAILDIQLLTKLNTFDSIFVK